jgi:hypothetical protein
VEMGRLGEDREGQGRSHAEEESARWRANWVTWVQARRRDWLPLRPGEVAQPRNIDCRKRRLSQIFNLTSSGSEL